ncbi:MAG: efflux RND transporter periplasmic adaptor subunit [Coriobacteriia bacterium]
MVKRIIIVIVVLAVLGGAGWWAWLTFGDDGTQATETTGGTGTVEAREVAISSVMPGRIVEVLTEEGSEVASGAPLFKLDEALLQLQVTQAEASVRAARATLDQAKADKGTTGEIASAQARLDTANAALTMAELQVEYATITAPMDGVVTQISAVAGENAAAGKTLATVADLSELTIKIYVPETEIGDVKIGDKATVTTDSSDRTFTAEVIRIASEAEFTPGNIETKEQRVKLVYEVVLAVENDGDVLKPGMLADVAF